MRFSFETRQQRLGGALGVSVLTHILVVGLFLFVASLVPKRQQPNVLAELRNLEQLVWLPEAGPGGGGGGGGNRSPEPPRKAELPGKEKLTAPVAKPPELEQPKLDEEPKADQQLTIPAQALASAEQTLSGALVGAAAASSLGPGAGGGAGEGEGSGIGAGRGSGFGPGEGGGTGGGVYRPGSGVTLPRPVREVKPHYTADAMRAKIQGSVWVDAIVLPDGSVGNVSVIKSLDPVFGLDEEAVKAARQWRFVPGTRFGQPVSVLVIIELTFTLR